MSEQKPSYEMWVVLGSEYVEGCLKADGSTVRHRILGADDEADDVAEMAEYLLGDVDPREVSLIFNEIPVWALMVGNTGTAYKEYVCVRTIKGFLERAGTVLPKHRNNKLESTIDLEEFVADHASKLMLPVRFAPVPDENDPDYTFRARGSSSTRYSLWLTGMGDTVEGLLCEGWNPVWREQGGDSRDALVNLARKMSAGIPASDMTLLVGNSRDLTLIHDSFKGFSRAIVLESVHQFLRDAACLLHSYELVPESLEEMWGFWWDHCRAVENQQNSLPVMLGLTDAEFEKVRKVLIESLSDGKPMMQKIMELLDGDE